MEREKKVTQQTITNLANILHLCVHVLSPAISKVIKTHTSSYLYSHTFLPTLHVSERARIERKTYTHASVQFQAK